MYAPRLTTRRAFLRLSAAAAIGTAVAACQTPAATPTAAPPTVVPPAPTATSAPPPTATTAPQPTATPPKPTAAPAATPAAATTPTQAKRAVALAGVYGGVYTDPFTNSFKPFTDSTGIAVNYSNVPADQGTPEFFQWIAGGANADVVDLSTPNLLLPAAKVGKVVDLNKALGAQTLKDSYDKQWLDWATMLGPGGTIVGGLFTLPFLIGVVWYPKAAFDKAGYKVPTTWDEMTALSDRIVKSGSTPWGFGNATWDGALGQVFYTDVLLRTASLADYDKHWRGDLKFSSPQVAKAFQMTHDLWLKKGYAYNAGVSYGGKNGINATQIATIPSLLFSDQPGVWMDYAPSFLPLYDGSTAVTGFTFKQYGTDYDFFLLPAIDKAYGAPAQVESHITSQLRDTNEARALMGYIASGVQGEAFVKQTFTIGGTPRKGAKLEWYRDPLSRRVAEVIQKAEKVRMLACDMMPWSVGAQLGLSLMDYVDGKVTVDKALKQIDDAWAAS